MLGAERLGQCWQSTRSDRLGTVAISRQTLPKIIGHAQVPWWFCFVAWSVGPGQPFRTPEGAEACRGPSLVGCLRKWLEVLGHSRVMLVLFLGPGFGRLEFQPLDADLEPMEAVFYFGLGTSGFLCRGVGLALRRRLLKFLLEALGKQPIIQESLESRARLGRLAGGFSKQRLLQKASKPIWNSRSGVYVGGGQDGFRVSASPSSEGLA